MERGKEEGAWRRQKRKKKRREASEKSLRGGKIKEWNVKKTKKKNSRKE